MARRKRAVAKAGRPLWPYLLGGAVALAATGVVGLAVFLKAGRAPANAPATPPASGNVSPTPGSTGFEVPPAADGGTAINDETIGYRVTVRGRVRVSDGIVNDEVRAYRDAQARQTGYWTHAHGGDPGADDFTLVTGYRFVSKPAPAATGLVPLLNLPPWPNESQSCRPHATPVTIDGRPGLVVRVRPATDAETAERRAAFQARGAAGKPKSNIGRPEGFQPLPPRVGVPEPPSRGGGVPGGGRRGPAAPLPPAATPDAPPPAAAADEPPPDDIFKDVGRRRQGYKTFVIAVHGNDVVVVQLARAAALADDEEVRQVIGSFQFRE